MKIFAKTLWRQSKGFSTKNCMSAYTSAPSFIKSSGERARTGTQWYAWSFMGKSPCAASANGTISGRIYGCSVT